MYDTRKAKVEGSGGLPQGSGGLVPKWVGGRAKENEDRSGNLTSSFAAGSN